MCEWKCYVPPCAEKRSKVWKHTPYGYDTWHIIIYYESRLLMDAVNQAGSPVESVDLAWDRMWKKRIHFVILVYFLKLVRCGNMVHNNKGSTMVHITI